MNYTINLRNKADLDLVSKLPVSNVLVQTEGLSRFGGIDPSILSEVLYSLKAADKQVILAWDTVSKDWEIKSGIEILKQVLSLNPKIRFLDPGIGGYLISHFPSIRLELSLEHGSLNSKAVKSWIEYFLPQIDKVVLSNQLPIKNIHSIRQAIPIKTEILGFGPIEIFYSRRHLLDSIYKENKLSGKNLTIRSKDRPDQENPIIQTQTGTIVFYDKAINVFAFHEEFKIAGINDLRIEYLNRKELECLSSILFQQNWQVELAKFKYWPTTTGFIKSNLSDSLFDQLSNPHIAKNLMNRVGTVIEAVKQRYCLIQLNEKIDLPISLEFQSPEGMCNSIAIHQLDDLKGCTYCGKVDPGVYRFSWQKYMVTGSILIKREP